MLKKFILFTILLFGMPVFSSENYLNSVVIEKNDNITNVIFRSDSVAKTEKETVSPDRVILTLKGIKQSSDITTLYKNIFDVSGFIIENSNKDLKVYIEAPEISKANIVFETPNSAPIVVSDNYKSESKIIWSIISVALLAIIMYSAKNINNDEKQADINEIIKEREMKLYKNFQREVASLPSMSYKLKSYRKHVLNGETIRSYESRLTKI